MLKQIRGQTRPGLNGVIIRGLSIPLPPLLEQRRIVEGVDRQASGMMSVEGAARSNVARCRSLRQAILKWAFEGKLVDQDPTDEPASTLLERIKAERHRVTPEANARQHRSRKVRSA
jgi:type I restriction enzyme S subunit